MKALEVLKKFCNSEISETEFMNELYYNSELQNLLEGEKKIGTHTGYDNFLLFLLDNTEGLKSIFYSRETKPLIKEFLKKYNIFIDKIEYLSSILDVWISYDIKKNTFNKLLNGNLEKIFNLKNFFCDWEHAIIIYNDNNTDILSLNQLDGFGDLKEKIKTAMENENIKKLNSVIALPEINTEIEKKSYKNLLYLGKIKMTYFLP